MNDNTFAIDINEKLTRMCDVRVVNNKIEIIAIGSDSTVPGFFTLDNEKLIEVQASIIRRLCSRLNIKKTQANVVIPDIFSFSQISEMPKLKEKELLAAIRYQADEFIPMPINETNIDLEILKEDEKSKKSLILIIASSKKMVNTVQQSIEKAGLTPQSLENELSAIGRFTNEIGFNKSVAKLIINFGYSSSSMYLIEANTGLMIMTRTMKLGWEIFIRDVRINLNIQEDKIYDLLLKAGTPSPEAQSINVIVGPILKEVLNEVHKFILLATEKHGQTIANIYLCNFDHKVPFLQKTIQATTTLPTASMNLTDVVKSTPLVASIAGELSSYISVISANLR
ncbi:MAG: pilus assembly protein PilM [Candidatus Roizmanbacteria bacterium]